MSDAEVRAADRTALVENSIHAWAHAQHKRCQKGEHCWSNWVSNHSISTGMNTHWTGAGFMVSKDYSIRTRECLICPARERMVRKLGDSIPDPNLAGVSTYEVLEERIFSV